MYWYFEPTFCFQNVISRIKKIITAAWFLVIALSSINLAHLGGVIIWLRRSISLFWMVGFWSTIAIVYVFYLVIWHKRNQSLNRLRSDMSRRMENRETKNSTECQEDGKSQNGISKWSGFHNRTASSEQDSNRSDSSIIILKFSTLSKHLRKLVKELKSAKFVLAILR